MPLMISGKAAMSTGRALKDALGQPRDQLQSRVQDEGQIGDKGLADLHHHLYNGGNQLRQCGSDAGSQGRHHLHCRL